MGAMKESIKYIQSHLSVKVDGLDETVLHQVAKTSLSSKFVGAESALFSGLVVDAIKSVKIIGQDGKAKYPVGQVNILKSHGQSSSESTLIPNGYAIRTMRVAPMNSCSRRQTAQCM